MFVNMAAVMKRTLNHIGDFLTCVTGEKTLVNEFLSSYLSSETCLMNKDLDMALNKLVDQLNGVKEELQKIRGSVHSSEFGETVPQESNSAEDIPSIDNHPKKRQKLDDSSDISESQVTLTQPPTINIEVGEEPKDSLPAIGNLEAKSKEKSVSKRSSSVVKKGLVQITADKTEINRRIAAFIEQKRLDVDEENRREFCSEFFPDHIEKEHCARTSAVFVPRSGCRSHVVVSRVVNINGPQLRIPSCTPTLGRLSQVKQEPEDMVTIKQEPGEMSHGIEERISNMETHLNIHSESNSQKLEIFQRLKFLEKRILFLESISPEYFAIQTQPISERRRKRSMPLWKVEDTINQDLSMWEIDERIRTLREVLHRKMFCSDL